MDLFFREVASWPRNETELSRIAEVLRAALDAPYALIWTHDLGIRLASLEEMVPKGKEKLLEELKTKAREHVLSGSGGAPGRGRVTHVELAQGPFKHLYYLPLDGEVKDEPSVGDLKRIREFGWLACGSAATLSASQVRAFHMAARYLSALAVISVLESSVLLRDQFLSIASHELKTPLTSIYGILQLQERMFRPRAGSAVTDTQAKQLSFFRMVIRQVERLNELIDHLLDISRIHIGRFMVEPSETEVTSLLNETLGSRLRMIAEEAGVELQVQAPGMLVARVDPVRFEEVITNLVMNAIRFSPEGGVVWAKLEMRGDDLVFSVRDQGPSIPEADHARIFQPFETAQRTTRLGGMGLGLFISKQISQLHGGDVVLEESIPSKGNLFVASFPQGSKGKRGSQGRQARRSDASPSHSLSS